MLWWGRRCIEIEKRLTWDDLKREIKSQFYPENVEYNSRRSLRKLKHKGTIKDYVKEFIRFMLGVTNMMEEERLFYFLDWLQSWVAQELQQRGVQDLNAVVSAAEKLKEYKRSNS